VTERIEDDNGCPMILFVEESSPTGHAQALWVRVGPVWDGDIERGDPGVWVEYQEQYLTGDLQGPVLLTPASWRALNAGVEARLRRKRRRWWRR
jgi:hypothetical protein